MKTKVFATIGLLATTLTANAGGLLTNTNQSIPYLRSLARTGAIGVDGVYFNPAGVAFLSDGFHLSLGVQNIYQTRTVLSGINIKGLENTPFYQPFKLNGGDKNGAKEYIAKASVPIFPTIQAAYNKGKWSFQVGFGLTGGGGKATFNNGLGSFERTISLLPIYLKSKGLGSNTPRYNADLFMQGQQYVFGLQLGTSYKINNKLAVYGGTRFNYIYNEYQGHIKNITANINGTDKNLHNYFKAQADKYSYKATQLNNLSATATEPDKKKTYTEMAKKAEIASATFRKGQEIVSDKQLDCTQRGWGITPIIGIDFKSGKWNLAARYELPTKINLENETKVDDTGKFKNGVNTPNDLPGLLSAGAQFEATKKVRLLGSVNYYFDKDAKMDKDKQKLLAGNTFELLGGTEWDITKAVTVSAGAQFTHYSLGNGEYLQDMSFVTSSVSFGFGAKIKVAKNASLNIAYFLTKYSHFKKNSEETINVGEQKVQVNNTDDFTRSNKVFGLGLDINF